MAGSPNRPGEGWHCLGKEAFDSGAKAIKAARHIKKLGKGVVDAYRCPTCSKFHIGRGQPKNKNKVHAKNVRRIF